MLENIINQDWKGKIVCLGVETGKEFRFIFHKFMFCVGLKAENSLCFAISIDIAQTAQS